MIIVKILGGLGNQLFQYAAGRCVAHRLGLPLALDVSGFEAYGLRRFELRDLAAPVRVATDAELSAFGVSKRSQGFWRRAARKLGFFESPSYFREASFRYDARVEAIAGPAYFDGYWQSERYFAPIGDVIRAEFSPREAPAAANDEMQGRIRAAGGAAVSLHIRRGDYVSDARTAQYHGVCSLDYYRAAVRYIAERVERPVFFVFSDDHAWVQENFDVGHPLLLVQCNAADRGCWDMYLMRNCRHHIIANSSFSWWGAWLNSNPDKIVVAPERWFAGGNHDTSDLVPASWVRL